MFYSCNFVAIAGLIAHTEVLLTQLISSTNATLCTFINYIAHEPNHYTGITLHRHMVKMFLLF
jgi:hypothetical protein